MPDSEEKSKVISVRVTPSFHERVKEAAQEQGYGTMTAAFRHSLATTLLDDRGSSGSSGETTTLEADELDVSDLDVDLSPVETRLETLTSEVRQMQEQLDDIGDQTDMATRERAQRISNNLPVLSRDADPSEELMRPEVSNYVGDTGAFQHIQQRLLHNSTEVEIRRALSHLQNENDQVESVDIDGHEHYFKREL